MWLSIHVLTITLSYGAFALAWGMGHVVVMRSAFGKGEENAGTIKIAQYLYRAVQIGVVLLASGTVLGGVWANYSWGRFWGWDPKETWALIALLGYLAVLHGRFAGWLGTFGVAFGSVIAFALVVMAEFRSNERMKRLWRWLMAAGWVAVGGSSVLPLATLMTRYLRQEFDTTEFLSGWFPRRRPRPKDLGRARHVYEDACLFRPPRRRR
jgi:cytochrome c biogenesis factor